MRRRRTGLAAAEMRAVLAALLVVPRAAAAGPALLSPPPCPGDCVCDVMYPYCLSDKYCYKTPYKSANRGESICPGCCAGSYVPKPPPPSTPQPAPPAPPTPTPPAPSTPTPPAPPTPTPPAPLTPTPPAPTPAPPAAGGAWQQFNNSESYKDRNCGPKKGIKAGGAAACAAMCDAGETRGGKRDLGRCVGFVEQDSTRECWFRCGMTWQDLEGKRERKGGYTLHVREPAPAPTPGPAACVVPTTPGLHRNVSCAGLAMWLSVPAGCAAEGCGLIIDVHGLSMNPDIQNNNSDMRRRGAAAGYAVLQPHGPCCDGGKLPCRFPCGPPNTNWGITKPPVDQNDAAVYAMVQAVMGAIAIDPKRVHMHGFSQGGDMAWRWLCKHADLLASIAPSSFTARDCFNDYGNETKVPTAHRIPVLYQHGYFDRVEASLRPAGPAGPAGWGPGGCCFDPTADSAWDTVRNLTAAWRMARAGGSGGDGYNRTRYVAKDGATFETIFHRFVTPQIQAGHCLPGGEDVVQPNPMAPGQVAMWSCTQRCDAWVWSMDNATAPPILCNKAVDVAPTDFPYNWNAEVIKWFDAHPKSA